MTPDEIIQRDIDNSGGNLRLDSNHAVEFISQIVMPDNDTVSISAKRKDFNKYYVSTLSLRYENSTTIFNNGKAVIIKNGLVQMLTDSLKLEEFLLQSFQSISYGYKKLKYSFKRLDDQQFKNFDCYVISAESPMGRKTLNYYDKISDNLIMVVYPNGNKTIFSGHYQTKGITSPSEAILVDGKNNIMWTILQKINYNPDLDTNWFHIPEAGIYTVPEQFKTGTYKYINSNEGARIIRDKTKQVEIDGESKTEFRIDWDASNNYLLYKLKDPKVPKSEKNMEYILVRIVAWNGSKYYCQYLTSENIGGTCAFEKIE